MKHFTVLVMIVYCLKGEVINSYLDVLKYKRRWDAVTNVYKQHYYSIIVSAKYRGEDILEYFKWDNTKEEWYCTKVFNQHVIKPKSKPIKIDLDKRLEELRKEKEERRKSIPKMSKKERKEFMEWFLSLKGDSPKDM